MAGRRQTYHTYNKLRFALFTHSYAGYSIKEKLRKKYKIHNRLTRRQLKYTFRDKRAIPEISKLSRTLNFDYPLLWRFIVFDRTRKVYFYTKDTHKIKAYLEIENEIITITIARQDKDNLIEEDYEYAILAPAIERAAGNHLSNIEDDATFVTRLEELQKKYQRWYYVTSYRYKLPTPRIIPFVMRLIS